MIKKLHYSKIGSEQVFLFNEDFWRLFQLYYVVVDKPKLVAIYVYELDSLDEIYAFVPRHIFDEGYKFRKVSKKQYEIIIDEIKHFLSIK